AWVAPRSGPEVTPGALVLRPYPAFDRISCRTEFRRHSSGEGALLDGGYQWIVSAVCPGSDPGGCGRQAIDAGPTEFSPGMGCGGDYHRGHVRRRDSHVCC